MMNKIAAFLDELEKLSQLPLGFTGQRVTSQKNIRTTANKSNGNTNRSRESTKFIRTSDPVTGKNQGAVLSYKKTTPQGIQKKHRVISNPSGTLKQRLTTPQSMGRMYRKMTGNRDRAGSGSTYFDQNYK